MQKSLFVRANFEINAKKFFVRANFEIIVRAD